MSVGRTVRQSERYARALVLGLGESGDAAARLLLSEGTAVVVVDAADNAGLRERAARLEAAGARVWLGARDLPRRRFPLCVVSPGIPADSRWVRKAVRSRACVMSELELGWLRCGGRVLAVTGSNGKSTMVKLCAEALRRAGLKAVVAGNYGAPMCRAVMETKRADWFVVEVSSFQLETVDRFRPDVGVLLNVYPNHLDRHGSMKAYAALKARLFRRMGEDDAGIVFEEAVPLLPHMRAKHRWITFGLLPSADFRFRSGKVTWEEKPNPALDLVGRSGICFKGTLFNNEVLGLTAAAAVAAARACGVDPACVARSARRFRPLPHRMQEAGTIGGVRFVDNSKATDLAALAASLVMVRGPVRLIAGGLLKERDLTSVEDLLAKRVRGAYLIGRASRRMKVAWGNVVPCCLCSDLREATLKAWKEAERGETVLLAPGCASFDQFGNFEERGNRFLEVVKSLRKERKVHT